ncbi:hypothetical protein [Arcobacter sp. FWKO B]|uniref:hypothetical protein n=1 Tax=Arcobacter sp. FWKO B TaxID=2593672 RepID=UPI0018A39226|nr:hypothetical protein [Arcobacter sp. FWKO B]QOG12060.1 hypothetical protein FWKOB_04795 [Arcobacter sp. FWKO B]
MKLNKGTLEPLLLIVLGLLIFFHFISASSLSISYKEVLLLTESKSLLSMFMNYWIDLLGTNSLIVRLPFIFFYTLSIILFYAITQDYFTKDIDRAVATLIFAILPGVSSAGLIISESIVVLFCILLYLYIYKITKKQNILLLFLFVFVDNSFAILYLSLFFYALYKKDNILLTISLVLFGLSMTIFGFDTSGKPRSHFVDTIGIYASIFSPLLFLYFSYAMYKISFKGTKSLYWFVSITAFAFSLLLSFRQKIDIADFAPFVVVAIPMMVKLFMHSYRVRLKQFRTKHKIGVNIVLLVLVLNFFLLHFNKPIYLILENPKKHFAFSYHFADEIASKLKERNINNVYLDDPKLYARIQMYGIKGGEEYYISVNRPEIYDDMIEVKVYDKVIYRLFVTKLNN